MREYEAVAGLLEKDLIRIYNEDHEISYEVKEHVAVVLSQFARAKGKFDQSDELYEDLFILYDKGTDVAVDPVILRGLVETLELTEGIDIKNESRALKEMVTNCGGDPGESIEKMLTVLKVIKDFVQGGNQNLDPSLRESPLVDICARQGTIETYYDNKVVPKEFSCPISLQLMQDPVIISSGQTYERTSIEKWMQAGNDVCPKTRQILANKTLIPNFALRSLIAQWEAKGDAVAGDDICTHRAKEAGSDTTQCWVRVRVRVQI
ncbi:hypothetical protein L1887_45898 [Cichorium endivia]|nr:hypothetical protein L1887_45898 [Cichorium endivia]